MVSFEENYGSICKLSIALECCLMNTVGKNLCPLNYANFKTVCNVITILACL